ncbi:MAG: hypothetical protein V4503_07655 [Gemmatimonadota bacterium]
MTYTFKLSRRIASNHRAGLAALSILLGACGAQGPTSATPVAPTPVVTAGWLTVQLTTPRSDDGAVQLSVSGPGVDSASISGYDGFSVVGNSAADMVITGALTSGNIARVHLRDLSRTGDVRATLSAAASRGDYQLQDLTGYRVVLVR